jgi:apolipoprotein D and lipocalin family protein
MDGKRLLLRCSGPRRAARGLSGVLTALVLAVAVTSSGGCSTTDLPPLELEDHVDLDRFMGDWYVIASIPTAIEEGAHNAVESYELDDDGTIRTTFTFRDGAFDGELRRYEPRGFVRDTDSNAVWGMQFVWPIKADYRILYVDDDYTETVIGRSSRDYVWIMARTPDIPDADYARLQAVVERAGYDLAELIRVPQRWD